MTSVEAEVIMRTLDRRAGVAKTEQLSLEVQLVLGLAEEAKTFGEDVSTVTVAARRRTLKDDKSLATRSKGKRADVEIDVEQARARLGAQTLVWQIKKLLLRNWRNS